MRRNELIQMFRAQKRNGIILLVLGTAALVVSGYFFMQTRQFMASAERVTGEIVDVQRKELLTNHFSYFTVFAFNDRSGARHTVRPNRGTDSPEYRPGDRVEVLYSLDHPENARLHDFISIWGITAGVGALGLLMEIVGAVLVYYAVNGNVDQLARAEGSRRRGGDI